MARADVWEVTFRCPCGAGEVVHRVVDYNKGYGSTDVTISCSCDPCDGAYFFPRGVPVMGGDYLARRRSDNAKVPLTRLS